MKNITDKKIHDLNLSKSIIIFDHYINNNDVSTYFALLTHNCSALLSATQWYLNDCVTF